MALQGTTTEFATLFSELSEYREADMYAHAESLLKWQALAEIAELQTDEDDTADSVYADVVTYHNNNMWMFAPNGEVPNLSHRAFTLALTSIELARTDAQGKAVTVLLSQLDELLYGGIDIKDDASRQLWDAFRAGGSMHIRVGQGNTAHNQMRNAIAEAVRTTTKSGERDFYIDMMTKLGPRLDPVNQATVMFWVMKNGMTDFTTHEGNKLAARIEDPDSFTRHYTDEARSEAAEEYLSFVKNSTNNTSYSDELISWVMTLLPKTDPRFIADIELPNLDNDEITPYSVWAAADAGQGTTLIFVDEENVANSRNIYDLAWNFRDASRDSGRPAEKRSRLTNSLAGLTIFFEEKASGTGRPADVQDALERAISLFKTRDRSLAL